MLPANRYVAASAPLTAVARDSWLWGGSHQTVAAAGLSAVSSSGTCSAWLLPDPGVCSSASTETAPQLLPQAECTQTGAAGVRERLLCSRAEAGSKMQRSLIGLRMSHQRPFNPTSNCLQR